MAPLYAAVLVFFVVVGLIPIQTRLFKAYGVVQPIRKELPADQQKKQGTPLMGGLIFITGAATALCVGQSTYAVLLAVLFILFAFIGFLDDFKKAHTKSPDGISGRTKLVLQFVVTFGALYYLMSDTGLEPHISITRHIGLNLPLFLFILIVSLIIVGSTNAINFTDGLDGLLATVAIPTYFFFFVISKTHDIQLFCLVMMACLLGFLLYNKYPAKLIMGDTGSMAIGGTLSFLAVVEHVLILLPLLFVVYFAEILSVIIQVAYFKRTGKRIFRMSPIHYHFSLKYGWRENTIVLVFSGVSWACSLMCVAYYEVFMR